MFSRRLTARLTGGAPATLRSFHAAKVARATTAYNMPAMSPTMTTGSIVRWGKKEGEKIQPGDVLLEIETDKATIDVEAQDAGVLAKILIPAGAKDVPVSKAIALIVDEGDDWKNVKSPVAAAAAASPKAATPPPTTGAPAPAPATPASVTVTAATTQPLSPAVTVLVQTHHLDVSKIPATGPHGRLLKGDVLQFLEKGAAPAPAPAPAPASAPAPVAVKQAAAAPASPAKPTTVQAPSYTDIPVTQIRKVIASRLQQSKFTIPHVYTTYSVDMDNAIAWRKACTEYLAKEEATQKVPSLNVLVIKAAAAALQRWPEVNVTVSAEGEAVRSASCDISFAVAMEKGLITPIVRGVERMRLGDLTREIDSLAARARAGKLKPEEYQGGSFSVSNLGMFGIKQFTAVINPPQAAILAVSGVRPVVTLSPDNKPVTVQMMDVTLSTDARVISQEIASSFLASFANCLLAPAIL